MSIFPTKILLATDGSKEAELASRTAAELSQGTSSELHVLYVGEAPNPYAEEVGLGGDDRQARAELDAQVPLYGPVDRVGRFGHVRVTATL